jgi:hypothetical protein
MQVLPESTCPIVQDTTVVSGGETVEVVFAQETPLSVSPSKHE